MCGEILGNVLDPLELFGDHDSGGGGGGSKQKEPSRMTWDEIKNWHPTDQAGATIKAARIRAHQAKMQAKANVNRTDNLIDRRKILANARALQRSQDLDDVKLSIGDSDNRFEDSFNTSTRDRFLEDFGDNKDRLMTDSILPDEEDQFSWAMKTIEANKVDEDLFELDEQDPEVDETEGDGTDEEEDDGGIESAISEKVVN